MLLSVSAERSLPCTPEVAFALATNADRFPTFFTGFGPIPGIIGIRLHSPLAVGSQRRVHSADGVVLTERVTEHDPPVRHGYVLSGFRPPMAWLVNHGEALWTFTGHELGCRVKWDYEFTLAKRWLAPLASVVVHFLMQRAMHRCLKNMARALDAPAAAAPARADDAAMGEWILLAMAPVFLGFVVAEAWYWKRRGGDHYSLRDTVSNAALALMHQGADAIAWLLVLAVYWWAYQYRLFEIPTTWWTIALLFLAQDFFYYFFHRASHRIRWLWASHVTHHSSERLNFSTAFRQSLTYPVSGMWVFWLPLAVIGFSPPHIVVVVAINLGFQFFVHTQAVGKLGWIEKVFNTPSHHRVHHARNPKYIDRNYAGVLIVWDKLFGSFVEEDDRDPCVYGLVKPVRSHNPLVLTFHEWLDMFADARRAPSWRARIAQLFGPPERAASQRGGDGRPLR